MNSRKHSDNIEEVNVMPPENKSKVVVLNGSPKGSGSVTIQSVLYLQKKFPEVDFEILKISQTIGSLERNDRAFNEVLESVQSSDGVLWTFPVYELMVPAQLKRFIELVIKKEAQHIFKDKYTAALSTSIHFNDHIPHRYIQGICDDFGMKFIDSFSADMMDLLIEEEQERLVQFGNLFISAIENKVATTKRFYKIDNLDYIYTAGAGSHSLDVEDKTVVVVTDSMEVGTNLRAMIDRFSASFSTPIEVVDLSKMKIVSGCIGCLQCGYDNLCIFKDKDEYNEFFEENILGADVLIFAGTMEDRFLSSLWKTHYDRSFYTGHKPALIDKQLGFIISGPLSKNENLRNFIEGYTEWQHANLLGVISDESMNDELINAHLETLAKNGLEYAKTGYIKPNTFLGVGGRKVFRDDIWGRLRTVFQADHRAYVELGWYDFPMRDLPTHIIAHLGTLGMSIPAARKKIQEMLTKGVSFRHRKIVEKA